MATIVLSAAGLAVGGAIGGSVAGLSTAVIGRAIGATLGRVIDQRLLGQGSDPVEVGRVEKFRLTGASDGAALERVFGRMRVGGQVIWATEFEERVRTSGGGGKGAPKQPETKEYSYSISLAVAVGEGEIGGIGRIWADGTEVSKADLNMRVYRGTGDQLPDPKIEAVEGAGTVPAYRGTAYVVFEDLALGQFGNRVPQFAFEVLRPAPLSAAPDAGDLARDLRALALIPGSGEYALATTPVTQAGSFGKSRVVNVNSPSGKSDIETSLEALTDSLPNCGSTSLIVSWFGDDLRCGQATLRPKVEQTGTDAKNMPWRVSGLSRGAAQTVAEVEGRPVYGGTPADASVIEAIEALKNTGQSVVFYPFILMEQLAGNGLPDPWTGAGAQPELPWRGRITLSVAPGQDGSPDGTAAADAEVDAFFGSAAPGDFSVGDGSVSYTGPEDWGFRRYILHYAHLCAAAGGVDAFLIGSEMRGLTQIRGASGFPAVAQMRALAADVRTILGPETKISYAADWSEYFGYQPPGTADRLFHLDPLWADPNIDFIGIDNYMPLSDWREGTTHLDAGWGSIYRLDYLTANVAGGEGYDWFYHSPEAREAQIRTEITDGEGEPWVWRYKDIAGWWANAHHDRIDGVRQPDPSAWVPQSKPVWFTEMGCAAIDKGTNQPNKFLDPKSSESSLPYFSLGLRDDYMQMQYLRAMHRYWEDPANNPVSEVYGGFMVDMSRAHVWAWDARPYPFFPANRELWSDGENYARGHWLNGRTTSRPLASVVAEICARAGLSDIDVSDLHGLVRGYVIEDTDTGRAALQPLMLAFGFDAIERDGRLVFRSRDGIARHFVFTDRLALMDETLSSVDHLRVPEAETAGRVRLSFVEADGDYEMRATEAIFPGDEAQSVSASQLPLAMTAAEGLQTVERWLSEARVARDTVRLTLPPSALEIGAGDVVRLEGTDGEEAADYRIDRIEDAGARAVEAVRIEPGLYRKSDASEDAPALKAFAPPIPVEALFLDLPLLTGDEVEHAPHVAMAADPWPGSAALYAAPLDQDYGLDRIIAAPSVMGLTETALLSAAPGLWDNGPALRVRLVSGALTSKARAELLAGANLAAIGDGSSDNWEVFQFANATLVGEDVYDLSLRLRGQAGTDGIMPADWPVGSYFVLLNGTPEQIDLVATARDVARNYRFGPALRPIDDPSYQHRVEAFRGIGLRPYAVAHLRAEGAAGADVTLGWIRRTRRDGDGWSGLDVPLGEATESYLVRVRQGSSLLREVIVGTPTWTYAASLQSADGAAPGFEIEVAQISDRFGPGPARTVTIA